MPLRLTRASAPRSKSPLPEPRESQMPEMLPEEATVNLTMACRLRWAIMSRKRRRRMMRARALAT